MLIKVIDLESERKVLSMWTKKSNQNSCRSTYNSWTLVYMAFIFFS